MSPIFVVSNTCRQPVHNSIALLSFSQTTIFLYTELGKQPSIKEKKPQYLPTDPYQPQTAGETFMTRSRADNRETLLLVKFIVQPLQFKHK